MNIFRSLAFDLRFILFERLKLRASADSYAKHRSRLLYPDYLKFGAALEAVRPLAGKYCRGRGLDVGAGRWPLAGSRAIEDAADENAYVLKESDESLDYVFSSHTLEHLERPWDAIGEWSRVLRHRGVLFMYLPHPACEMWNPKYLPFHRWCPDPVVLETRLSQEFGYEIIYITYLPDAFFSFVVVAQKNRPDQRRPSATEVRKN